jgi:uncharacterized protein YndB with AHSA1/START domain
VKARTLSVSIDASPERVYAFAADPLNMPKWAAGLGRSISRIDARWVVETPSGVVTVEFAPNNAFGVLDHTVTLPDATQVYLPVRVVANGSGSELVFTLFQTAQMSDAQFEQDAALVAADLRTLKGLLEALPQ